jgi:hypothetical protein
MQIKMFQDGKMEWFSVRPTNGKPYEYDTKEEAERMLRMCYPLVSSEEARVKEIS